MVLDVHAESIGGQSPSHRGTVTFSYDSVKTWLSP
jgi:hypothetical protein